MINIEEFKKIEIKLGEILEAEKIPDTDKLLKLKVNMGEEAPRQIVSGIATYFPDPSVLIGRKCVFVANLEPRIIRGFESQGMILALSSEDGKFSLLSPDSEAGLLPGTLAK
jgi:methionyl-tRNA synthetase